MSVNDATKSGLAIDTSPDAFFFELVHSAVQNQKVKIQPETEFYIVKLLNRFIFSESLYSKNSDGSLEDQPLVFLYKEAIESEDVRAKKALFQNVGDISLYKAGFFQENLTKFKIDIGYFINIGGAAYHNAAERSEDKNFKEMFSELSHKFHHFVDVLSEVSEQTTVPTTEQDLFKLYDMWSRTGSERAARALKKAGIKIAGE
jgi:hypothetical protein